MIYRGLQHVGFGEDIIQTITAKKKKKKNLLIVSDLTFSDPRNQLDMKTNCMFTFKIFK